MFHQLLSIGYTVTFTLFERKILNVSATISIGSRKMPVFFFSNKFLEISETNPRISTTNKCFLRVHTIKSVVTNTDGN